MSTPAVIKFEDDGAVYLHWDGYPEDVAELWDDFRRDVIKSTSDTRFDDPSYLAARFVAYYTRNVWGSGGYGTGIGVVNPAHNYGQSYTYEVRDGFINRV